MMLLADFDPDFAGPSDWAIMYRRAGLQVVPAPYPMRTRNDKRPTIGWKKYQDDLANDENFDRWFPSNCSPNMGVIAGRASGNLLVIDLDDYKPGTPAGEWWLSVTGGIDRETWIQTTGGGGRQIFFRLPEGVTISSHRTAIDVDIRAQGGFAMLPPSLHLSGKEYAWQKDRGPWECEIEEAPQFIIDAVVELIEEHGGVASPLERRERTDASADYNAFGAMVDGREDYMTRLVWGAVVDWHRECPIPPSETESSARMREAYVVYERSVGSRLNDPASSKSALLEREGRGASMFAEKWRNAMKQWDGKVAEHAKEARLSPSPLQVAAAPVAAAHDETAYDDNGLVAIQSAFPIDPASIPPRDWVIPGLLLRRYLSVLVAPPGSGKSLLTLQLALACSTGISWGGWIIRKPAKTLVVNAEDDLDEMRRRLWAAAQEMNIPAARVADKLFLAESPESIVIAKSDPKTKSVVRMPLMEKLIDTIVQNEIDVVVVDPFAETFEGDENDNSQVKWAGIAWREVARRTGASVFLVHHTRKYAGGMAGDADASRGGGALIGTARIVSTLFAMTEDEAKTLSIPPEERGNYVRFDDAKANLSLVSAIAKWFVKKSVTIPNGRELLPGDEVGVLEPWKPPGVLEGFTAQSLNLLLDAIDRGLLNDDGQPSGARYTFARNSKARWVGDVIETHLRCDEDKAMQIARLWKKSGLLVESEYHDGKQERKGLHVDGSKRPGRES